MENITIRLADGQVLFFTPTEDVARAVHRNETGPSELEEIESVKVGESPSERVSQLPDLVFRHPGKPNEVTLVEIKSRRPKVAPQLSDSALHRRLPEIFQTIKSLTKQLWEVDLQSRTLSVFPIDSEGRVSAQGTRYKITTLIQPLSAPLTLIGDAAEVTADSIQLRVNDWEKRIKNLYGSIAEWVADSPYTVADGSEVTMYEELMQQFGVSAKQLSTLKVLNSDIVIVELRPKGLWIIGANGRIDVVGHKKSALLVDSAEFLKPSKWLLYSAQLTRTGVPFSKESLLALLAA